MTTSLRHHGEGGTITVLVVGLTLALLMVAGLVYDGGRVLAARRQAHDLADNAARAAAQAVDVDTLRAGGPPALDAAAAMTAAEGYLALTGHRGDITVTGDRVTVTVIVITPMALLQLVGLSERTVTASGQARIARGISTAED
ncbi:MAG TPA: pilus assembly protein TadG-related protein [Nitriliruptorales bacterium]